MKHLTKYICLLLPFLLLVFGACHNHDHHDEENSHDDDHEHSGIVLEPEQAKEFGIEFETVEPGIFNTVIKTSGTIEASNSDLMTATAKKSGIITLSPGLTVGAQVTNGQKLGSISNAGVQGAELPQVANTNLEALKKEYERLKPLYEDGLVTTQVFQEAEKAYKEAESLSGYSTSTGTGMVSAPGAGSIQNLYVKSGDYVEVGAPVATIAKNSTQILKADLPSREGRLLPEIVSANFIPEGSSSVLRLDDFNGKKISGATSLMSNGYIPVYFSFNGNSFSTPGGYAEVFLICGEREGVISVPREALVEIQGNKYIYIVTGDHSYEKRIVSTGFSDGERIEIKEGLRKGEKIVAKGASVVRMAEISSIAPPAHSHNH